MLLIITLSFCLPFVTSVPLVSRSVEKLQEGIFVFGGTTLTKAGTPNPKAEIFYPPFDNTVSLNDNSNMQNWMSCVGASAVFLDGQYIIMTGGDTHPNHSFCYDAYNNQETQPGKLTEERVYHTSVILKGIVHVCGGEGKGTSDLATCESYDYLNNKWSTIPSMQTGRSHHAAAVAGERMFQMGGGHLESEEILNTVESYNAKDNTWRVEPSMRTKRHSFGAAVWADTIIVCGGSLMQNEFTSCEKFAINSDKWEMMGGGMQLARKDFLLVNFQNVIYALGGYNKMDGIQDSIESMDVTTGTWSPHSTKLRAKRSQFVATAIVY